MKEIVFKEEFQMYARILKILGDGRAEVLCDDLTTRVGRIRGKMRKKTWIRKDDLVLVDKREFESNKVDITHKYTETEELKLKKMDELPEEWFKEAKTCVDEEEDDEFDFELDEEADVDVDAI